MSKFDRENTRGEIDDDAIELDNATRKVQSDDNDLVRLGKKPVLKVPISYEDRKMLGSNAFAAELWIHFNSGIQLHMCHYLGGVLNVC